MYMYIIRNHVCIWKVHVHVHVCLHVHVHVHAMPHQLDVVDVNHS